MKDEWSRKHCRKLVAVGAFNCDRFQKESLDCLRQRLSK